MTHIVKQGCRLDLVFFIPLEAKMIREEACQMERAKAVLKPRMVRPRIDEVCQAKLFDPS